MKLLYDEYSQMMDELYSMVGEKPIEEKFVSKDQQKYFYWKAGQKGKEWEKMADEFSSTMTKKDWEKLPKKVTNESINNLNPKISKKSLVEYVTKQNSPVKVTKKEIIKQIKRND